MDLQVTPLDSRSAAPVSLDHWERLMRHAHVAARMDQTLLALATCWQALAIAQELIGNPPVGRADDCVAALVVSHHHLADLQQQAEGPDLAAEQLCRAHEALMALLRGASGDVELQQAAWRHSRETHAGLLGYLAEYGPHPAIARALRAGCLTFAVGAPAGSRPH